MSTLHTPPTRLDRIQGTIAAAYRCVRRRLRLGRSPFDNAAAGNQARVGIDRDQFERDAKAEPATDAPRGVFQGFPYLATRIEGPMQHLMVLPEKYAESRLVELLYAQVKANRLPTALVLSNKRAIYLGSDLGETHEGGPPVTTLPVHGMLAPAENFTRTQAFEHRRKQLRCWAKKTGPQSGYFVANRPTGESPTRDELKLLGGRRANGVPPGLVPCKHCGNWKGKCLDPLTHRSSPSVIEVHCACDNWNRCAACGKPLNVRDRRPRSFFFEKGKVLYVPGFGAFEHISKGLCRVGSEEETGVNA